MKTIIRITTDGIKVKAEDCTGSYILGPLSRKGKNLICHLKKHQQSWWQLYSFEIAKASRGKGYGKLLMKDALSRSQLMGCSIILQAQAYENNGGLSTENLVKFYQTSGFVLIDQPNRSYWLMWETA